jgi:hypothetical protein
VILFAKNLRQLKRGALQPHEYKGKQIQAPSQRVHVDFAPANAEATMGIMVPGGTDLIQNSTRWQILGVWTPTKLVNRDPLALMDSRSIPESDYLDLSRDKTARGRSGLCLRSNMGTRASIVGII